MDINYFTTGSFVVRTIPSDRGDRSYIGVRCIFLEIENGLIYLYDTEDNFLDNKIIKLSLDGWSKGWQEYVTPKHLGMEKEIKQLLKNY